MNMVRITKVIPAGSLEFAITSADHVSIQGRVEVRGHEYRMHVHMHLQRDGSWDNRYVDKSGSTQTVQDWVRRNQIDYATPTVEAKVVKMVRDAWAEFVASPEAPAALAKADAMDAANDLARAKSDRDKAAEELRLLDEAMGKAAARFNVAIHNHLVKLEERSDIMIDAGLDPESDKVHFA